MAKHSLDPKKQAIAALRNGISRAKNHIFRGDLLKACDALISAANTARKWLDGTHPRLQGE